MGPAATHEAGHTTLTPSPLSFELMPGATGATTIMDGVAAEVPDVRLGLVSHEDYAGSFSTSTADGDGPFPDGADPAAAVSDLITDQASSLERLALEVCSSHAGFSDWLVSVTPAEVSDVELPATHDFDLEVGPPEGTEPGEHAFQLCLNGDGVEFGRVDVVVTVPGAEDAEAADVVIDVKPGSDVNPININKKHGDVPAAGLRYMPGPGGGEAARERRPQAGEAP